MPRKLSGRTPGRAIPASIWARLRPPCGFQRRSNLLTHWNGAGTPSFFPRPNSGSRHEIRNGNHQDVRAGRSARGLVRHRHYRFDRSRQQTRNSPADSHFLLTHLQTNPRGCLAWPVQGSVILETNAKLHPLAVIKSVLFIGAKKAPGSNTLASYLYPENICLDVAVSNKLELFDVIGRHMECVF